MRVNRFVLDTNIWVTYFISGKLDTLLTIIHENEITVYACAELLAEVERVLNYEHLKKYKPDVKEAMWVLKEATLSYEISYPIKKLRTGRP